MYDESTSMIVSRNPTVSQLDEFWSLVFDTNVSVIVTISETEVCSSVLVKKNGSNTEH